MDFLDDEPTISELDGVRYLHFSSPWVQGAMRIAKPNELVLEYTQQMMAWLLFKHLNDEDEIAILGLGAGSLLRYALFHTKNHIESVERNPLVTAICRTYFRLPSIARCKVTHEDAENWVTNKDNQNKFAVIMIDLYDAHAQGPVCDSLDFYENCRACLSENGIATINLFGNHPSFQDNIENISQAFNSNYVTLPTTKDGNTVVLAFKDQIKTNFSTDFIENAQKAEIRYKLPTVRWARSLLTNIDIGATK